MSDITSTDYDIAYNIGHAAAADKIMAAGAAAGTDVHDLDDAVFPRAFSEACDALPAVDAPEISSPVHEGIADAWEAYA